MNRLGLGTDEAQLGGSSRVVLHFDQERAPAVGDQFGFGGALGRLDAHFGIDVDAEKAERIKGRLNFFAGSRGVRVRHRGVQSFPVCVAERRPDQLHRFNQALDLRVQGLKFDTGNNRQSCRGLNLGGEHACGRDL